MRSIASRTEGVLIVPQGTLSSTKQKRLAVASLFCLERSHKFDALLFFELCVRTTTYFRMEYFPYGKYEIIHYREL